MSELRNIINNQNINPFIVLPYKNIQSAIVLGNEMIYDKGPSLIQLLFEQFPPKGLRQNLVRITRFGSSWIIAFLLYSDSKESFSQRIGQYVTIGYSITRQAMKNIPAIRCCCEHWEKTLESTLKLEAGSFYFNLSTPLIQMVHQLGVKSCIHELLQPSSQLDGQYQNYQTSTSKRERALFSRCIQRPPRQIILPYPSPQPVSNSYAVASVWDVIEYMVQFTNTHDQWICYNPTNIEQYAGFSTPITFVGNGYYIKAIERVPSRRIRNISLKSGCAIQIL